MITTTNLTTMRTIGRYGTEIDLIVMHTMEAAETPWTAENVAEYFKRVKASAQWCVDNNSRVRSVKDEDMAWTQPGAQARSLSIELAGYAKQSPADWIDQYSLDMLGIAAVCAAEWVIKYGIPIRRLTDAQIRDGAKGFCGHVDINRVYKRSTHWDPGPNFPWHLFLTMVEDAVARIRGGDTTSRTDTRDPLHDNVGHFGALTVKELQTALNAVGEDAGPVDGVFGPRTIRAYQNWLARCGAYHGVIDGVFGPVTAKAEQAWLKSHKVYDYGIDGDRGPWTIRGLQLALGRDHIR